MHFCSFLGSDVLRYKCYVDDINMVVSVPNEIDTRDINIDERAKEGIKVIKRIGQEITELGPKSVVRSEK